MTISACVIGLIASLASPVQDWQDEVARLLDERETGEAIALLEKETRADPTDAEAWVWLGEAYYRLAENWAEQGSNPQAPLTDARAAFDRALALRPFDRAALQGAYDACLELGELDAAASYALRDLALAQMVEGEATPWELERLAHACALAFRENVPTAPLDLACELRQTLAIVRQTVELAPADPALASTETELLQQVGLFGLSSEALRRGIEAAPSAGELHQKLVELHFAQDSVSLLLPFYEALAKDHPEDGTVAWYRGYVALLEGDVLRRECRYDEAIDLYSECATWMTRASSLEPAYADGSRRIEVLARSGIGWAEFRRGDREKARSAFVTLLRTQSEHRNLRDSFQRTYLDGLGALGAEFETAQDFATGIGLAREVLSVESTSAYWWNNLGFFLREYGSQTEAGLVPLEGDREAAARKIFEESWQAYLRAAELAPDDARIVNDAALIQVYHLRTELDRGDAMLRQAIDAGEKQLGEMGEEAPEEERYPVAQAVGDAYQNLGYLYYQIKNDPAKARPFFVKSMEVDPVARFAVRQTIEAIDAGRVGVAEDVAGPAPSSAESPRVARGYVAWERDFAQALERARLENRPLFVYQASGLTLNAPFLDSLVQQAPFAAAAGAAVCVVADKSRYNMVDRGRDARRIAAAKYGTVTSGELIAVHAALTSWWDEHRGEGDRKVLGEGFHFFSPAGERLDVRSRGSAQELFERAQETVGEPRLPPDLDSLQEALLGGRVPEMREAARRLVTYPWAKARDRGEALLFDGATPRPARIALLEGLAEARDGGASSLLASLVAQDEDPELAELAADMVPIGFDPQPLRFALDWSHSASKRSSAALALARTNANSETARLLVAHLVAADEKGRRDAAAACGLLVADLEEVLLAALEWEQVSEVRQALCEALAHGSDAVVPVLADLQTNDPDPLVRAAARRALEAR
ncbi:MAG: hypothetical protein AB1486_01440 [Planctomycetota bacterium]